MAGAASENQKVVKIAAGTVLLGRVCGIIHCISITEIVCRCPNRHIFHKAKEAVPIDPKKQRHISTEGSKTPADAAGKAKSTKKKRSKPRRSVFGTILRFIGCLFCVCIMLGSVAAVMLSMYIVEVTADDADVLDLDNQKNKQTTIIYDKYGEEYATLSGDENRIWRDLVDMPKDLQNAVVAIEDKNFYNEPGINIKRTIAAALNEFTGSRLLGSKQGASTIEQQLIKNLTKDDEQDIMRKVREIFRALGLANRYSKETVLEAYLNTIPLTGTVCGMEAGAQEYFGKHVEDLTLSECAALASITKNPTRYNPFTNPEMLIARRNHVLNEMCTQGYITEAERDAAKAETITLVESKSAVENATRSSSNSYYTDAVYEDLKQKLVTYAGMTEAEASSAIYNDGLRIYSNVDPDVQAAAEQIMYDEDSSYFPALWREEEVQSKIPNGTEITYDEDGMPVNPPGDYENWAIFQSNDIPVYTDEENGVFKTKQGDDGYIVFYEKVRTQASLATLDYDGNIIALVGGVGEKKVDRGTNRATLPHQTGSTMKPIASYCLALDYGLITYSSPVSDTPIYSAAQKEVLKSEYAYMDKYSAAAQARDDIWRDWPENYGGKGGDGDNVLIYDAIQQSYNTVAVQVGSWVGVEYMYNFVSDTLNCAYLSAENDMDLGPMVLGSQYQGLTAVELAGAYSIFNDGSYTTPHYYEEVYDYQGNLYFDNTKYISTTQAIQPETAVIMNKMLQNVLYNSAGTAYGRAPSSEMKAAAKTGTTSNYKDYTFCGLTPYYVTGMWWGYDKPANMYEHSSRQGQSGKTMQYAWKEYMEIIQADLPVIDFYQDEDVVEKQFDPATGAIISGGGRTGYYTEDNLPDASFALTDEELAAQAAAADAQAAIAAAAAQ